MADLTVSNAVDTMMQAADAAGIRSAIGAAGTASPAFTGTPTAPTATGGTNTTQIATTAFVQSALAGVTTVLAGEVATFADLPAAASNSGKNYLVRQSSGVYFVSRKVAGIYTSDGASWNYDGDSTEAYFQDTLAWTNITSKPSTFTPSAHTHPQSDVTNLVTDLAAKAAAADLTSHVNNTSNPHSVTKTQVGLGNVTDAAQTLASVFPNTLPSAGQIGVGNAGGTAYAPQTVSGDATLASTGALTIANNAVSNAKLAQMATLTIKGNNTGGTANALDLTASQVKTMLSLTSSDVGLGNVTNAAQTLASVVPNTAPAAGEILVGNAGGTAYAKAAMSGEATLASTGAITLSTTAVVGKALTGYSSTTGTVSASDSIVGGISKLNGNTAAHTGASSSVHGVTGSVLGTTDTQNVSNKTITASTYNGLTPTAQATGFTLAGGTSSKTLTLSDDATVNQSVATTSSPTFANLNVTTNIGYAAISPTARLHLPAGTATAGTAPLKLTAGTVNTSSEAGAIEFDGTDFFISI